MKARDGCASAGCRLSAVRGKDLCRVCAADIAIEKRKATAKAKRAKDRAAKPFVPNKGRCA